MLRSVSIMVFLLLRGEMSGAWVFASPKPPLFLCGLLHLVLAGVEERRDTCHPVLEAGAFQAIVRGGVPQASVKLACGNLITAAFAGVGSSSLCYHKEPGVILGVNPVAASWFSIGMDPVDF